MKFRFNLPAEGPLAPRQLSRVFSRHAIARLLMSRLALFWLLWVPLSLWGATTEDIPGRPPNIILIMADDLGWAELGCYGQQKIVTPHLDRLAGQGMRLTQFYSAAPVCAPARCCLLTGMHTGHATVRDNYEVRPSLFGDAFGGQYPLPPGTVTIASLLKAGGYVTGAFGKWGLGGVGTTGDPLRQGFDRFFGFNCQRHAHNLYPRYLVDDRKKRTLPGNRRALSGPHYGPQVVADELLAFVRENKDRPFFVYYASVLPHLALQVPAAEIASYRGKWPETPYAGQAYLPHPTPKACYAAMVSFLDKQVGRLTALLRELDLEQNTIVLFTSDNGTAYDRRQVDSEFFASVGPLRGLKGSVYEGGVRVPLIARWPGKIPPASRSVHVAALYDVLPTLCAVAGIEPPDEIDGISFLPTLRGQGERGERHEYLVWDFAGYGGQLALRWGDWKAVLRNQRKDPPGKLELYHLGRDLGEQQNVARQYPHVVARMKQMLQSARQKPQATAFRFGRYGSAAGP